MPLNLPQSDHEFRNALIASAKVAVKQYAALRGDEKPFISLTEAYRRYTAPLVNKWIKAGYVQKHKNGPGNHKVRLSIVELEASEQTENLAICR